MNFMKLIQDRYSVRSYLPKAIEEEKVRIVLEAGRLAPTAANKQSQRFLVVSSNDELAKLNLAANTHGAPLAIVTCGLTDKAWIRPQDGHQMTEIDATIATDHMMLAAWAQGLGSCWITWFDVAKVKEEFHLPTNVQPINILALGYACGTPPPPNRHTSQRMLLGDMILNAYK